MDDNDVNLDYFNSLGNYDLMLRHANDNIEYTNRYLGSFMSFNNIEKKYLTKICGVIDKILYRNAKWLLGIKWKFRKMKFDISIEGGNPHTMGSTIIIPDVFFMFDIYEQIEILIHERVHIWQRKNKKLFEEYLLYNGYKMTNYRTNLAVSNPDTVGNWTIKGKLCETRSRNGTLSMLDDQHPYERFAYEVADGIVRREVM